MMKRVKDIDGEILVLLDDCLSETPIADSWQIPYTELRRAARMKANVVKVFLWDGEREEYDGRRKENHYNTTMDFEKFRIGCRNFDQAAFKKILLVAGAKVR